MNDTPLIFRIRKGRSYGFFHSGQSVRTDYHNILYSTVFQFVQNSKPVLAAFVFSDLQADYILSAIQSDCQNYIGCKLLDAIVFPD